METFEVDLVNLVSEMESFRFSPECDREMAGSRAFNPLDFVRYLR